MGPQRSLHGRATAGSIPNMR